MSQLFDYMVCTSELLNRWIDAMEAMDEELQAQAEEQMPRFQTLKNTSQDYVCMLAQAIQGPVDVVQAAVEIDLVKAVSDEGPWVIAFRKSTIAAIASGRVDAAVVERWRSAALEFYETESAAEILSLELASDLKNLCIHAVENDFGMYVCFYG